MSCIFMPCHLVRQFHVRHFQSTRLNKLVAGKLSCAVHRLENVSLPDIRGMSASEVSLFHGIALYKSTFTYLHAHICTGPLVDWNWLLVVVGRLEAAMELQVAECTILVCRDLQAQIPLGSSCLDTFDVSSESRRARRAVLFQHDGQQTSYSARLYKFSHFMLLHTQSYLFCQIK